MSSFLVKHTLSRNTEEAISFQKYQQWVCRYRGPFETSEEAEEYMIDFVQTYPSIKFEVVSMTPEAQQRISGAIYSPIPFRDPKVHDLGWSAEDKGWAHGDTFGHRKEQDNV